MFIGFLGMVVLYFLFRRNIQIARIPQIDEKELELTRLNIVDLRDYNVSYKSPIENAMNIPVPYIKRHYKDIKSNDLIVAASNRLEKNVGIRILRRKGFKVVGYILIDSYKEKNNIIAKNVCCVRR